MPIRISHEDNAVSFPELTSTNPLVVAYFDQLPDAQRMAAYEQVLAVGVMAMREERIAAFLARTESELGVNMEFLKHLFTRDQLRMTSAPVKGEAGESAVANALVSFTEARKLPDSIQLVGRTAGALARNRTGDIVCTVGDGDDAPTIVIECKLDKSIRLGDPAADGMTTGKSDTAWSQLIEARANRGSDLAIMVFSSDSVSSGIGQCTDSVRHIDGIGFVVIIDLVRGDFRPLAIAYELARQQAMARRKDVMDPGVLDALTRRLCADLTAAMAIKDLIEGAVANCNAALKQIEVSIANAGATHKALQSYLKSGRLDNQQLLELLVPHKVAALR
jgi:hypothetical protein